jgi:alpha-beta hydrolase superfamily lysophospholipase
MTQRNDILPGFLAEDLVFPNDYDGPVVATLVSRKSSIASNKAVLYVHGYCDYFFNPELAQFYNSKGFNFYAIDLRKYGRSIRTGQHFNFCKDMIEYYADLDAAISIIRGRDANTTVLLNGHSTGGLLATIYANARRNTNNIQGLFLNSPFYDFNDVWSQELLAKYVIATVGLATPFLVIPSSGLPMYGESVAAKYNRGGTAVFDENWKPVHNVPPVCAGWVRAIRNAQLLVQSTFLYIKVPTLLMHSDKSGGGATYNDSYNNSDCVLDVKEIDLYGSHIMDIGKESLLTKQVIVNGLHDLSLSRTVPRADFYTKLSTWMTNTFK